MNISFTELSMPSLLTPSFLTKTFVTTTTLLCSLRLKKTRMADFWTLTTRRTSSALWLQLWTWAKKAWKRWLLRSSTWLESVSNSREWRGEWSSWCIPIETCTLALRTPSRCCRIVCGNGENLILSQKRPIIVLRSRVIAVQKHPPQTITII